MWSVCVLLQEKHWILSLFFTGNLTKVRPWVLLGDYTLPLPKMWSSYLCCCFFPFTREDTHQQTFVFSVRETQQLLLLLQKASAAVAAAKNLASSGGEVGRQPVERKPSPGSAVLTPSFSEISVSAASSSSDVGDLFEGSEIALSQSVCLFVCLFVLSSVKLLRERKRVSVC